MALEKIVSVRQTASAFAKDAFGNALATEVIKWGATPKTTSPAAVANNSPSGDSKPSPQAPSNVTAPSAEEDNRQINSGGGNASDKAASSVAVAQKAQAAPIMSDEIDEIVVTGVRGSSDIPNYRIDPWSYHDYFAKKSATSSAQFGNDYLARNKFYTGTYAKQFAIEQQPWFGLASLASDKVYTGLRDTRLGAIGLDVADLYVGKGFFNVTSLDENLAISHMGFAEGNQRIFEDQNTAYEIYKDGGVDALRSLTESGVFGNRVANPYVDSLVQGYEAWDRAKAYRSAGDMAGFNRESDSSLRYLADYEQRVIIQPVYDKSFTVIDNAGNPFTNTLRGSLSSVSSSSVFRHLPDQTAVNVLGTSVSFKGVDIGDVAQRMQRINLVANAYMSVYSQPTGTQQIQAWHTKLHQ